MTHVPVLLEEVLKALDLRPGSFVVDGTVDGGGHAEQILSRIGASGRLLGLDWDPALLETAKARLGGHPNVILAHANYTDLARVEEELGLPKADALLLDLGFSSEQLEGAGKGISFSADEPLTMTYDPAAEPAYEILRSLGEAEIEEMLRELGEERYSRRIAQAIYARERKEPIRTSKELAELVRASVPANYERGRIHPAPRTFQALRIYTNDELGNVRRAMADLPLTIAPDGRVAIITFHSIEDRAVKHVFRDMEKEGLLTILTKKPIEASAEEKARNPRSRSAKLRVARMK